jgi:hypothetical protein
MADQWYLSRDGQSFGPYTWNEIVSFSKTGHLKSHDQLWSSVNNQWIQADQISGLFPSQVKFAPTPPSSPPKMHVPIQYTNIPNSSSVNPVHFNVDYPQSLSRGVHILRTLLGYFYVMIPHGFLLAFYGIAVSFVMFIAWWIVLFTGTYPESMFRFVERYFRWSLRVGAYMAFMTDIYPPFNGNE